MGKPWGIFEPTEGDLKVSDFFQEQLYPGLDHIHQKPFPTNPEVSYLYPLSLPEMFDVQLSDASVAVLADDPVILPVGDIGYDSSFVLVIEKALQGWQPGIAFGTPEKRCWKKVFRPFNRVWGCCHA